LSPVRVKNFIFATSSKPFLGPTQSHIKWIRWALSRGIKWLGPEANHSPETGSDVKKMWVYIPVDEALQVIRNKLHNDDILAERFVLQIEASMELLEVREPRVFRWTISSSNRKMACLWAALCLPSLATSSWSILREWL
jgi:hypothetical protein